MMTFAKVKLIAKQTGLSERTLWRRVEELKRERERYGDKVVIYDDGIVLVNELALTDYLFYRQRLKDTNLRKSVPPYSPRSWAKERGQE